MTQIALERIPIQALFEIRGASIDLDYLTEQLEFPTSMRFGQLATNASMQYVRFGPKRGLIKSDIYKEILLESKLLTHASERQISCVNVSDMYSGFLIRGTNKIQLLNQIVSINLHRLKPASAVATEVFELGGILIHSIQSEYEVYVARSYEDYVWNRIVRCKESESANA